MNFDIPETEKIIQLFENKSEYKYEFNSRVFNFVLSVVNYLRKIEKSRLTDIFIYQLGKSATSIGANLEEAQGASSKKDFVNKMSIAHRESKETVYWLKLLQASDIKTDSLVDDLLKESKQIRNILGSIVGKTRNSL